jgi:hypothetical protein
MIKLEIEELEKKIEQHEKEKEQLAEEHFVDGLHGLTYMNQLDEINRQIETKKRIIKILETLSYKVCKY